MTAAPGAAPEDDPEQRFRIICLSLHLRRDGHRLIVVKSELYDPAFTSGALTGLMNIELRYSQALKALMKPLGQYDREHAANGRGDDRKQEDIMQRQLHR